MVERIAKEHKEKEKINQKERLFEEIKGWGKRKSEEHKERERWNQRERPGRRE